MYISDFKYYKPKSLLEAYGLLNTIDNAVPVAGGTDLLVEIKQGLRKYKNIISLNGIDELKGVKEENNCLIIGSCTTHSEIIRSDIINNYFPALAQTSNKIGTHQIQNTGTIGGNLCTCASCADTAPILMVYDAEVEIASIRGTKRMKLEDFFINHHVTILEKDELLTKIFIPKKLNFSSYFDKFGIRESASISVASVAIGLSVINNIISKACIVIGACAPTPMKAQLAMSILNGKYINEFKNASEIPDKIGEAAAKEILPVNDIRGSADYRRNIVKTLTKRAVLKVINNIK